MLGENTLFGAEAGLTVLVWRSFASAGEPKGQGASGKPPASINVRQLVRKGTLAGGVTRRLRRGRWGCRPEGVVLSFDAKESTKESQRHGDSEGGPRRYAPWASACGSPFGAVLGLGSLRSPAGKSPLMPIFERGSSQYRAQWS